MFSHSFLIIWRCIRIGFCDVMLVPDMLIDILASARYYLTLEWLSCKQATLFVFAIVHVHALPLGLQLAIT